MNVEKHKGVGGGRMEGRSEKRWELGEGGVGSGGLGAGRRSTCTAEDGPGRRLRTPRSTPPGLHVNASFSRLCSLTDSSVPSAALLFVCPLSHSLSSSSALDTLLLPLSVSLNWPSNIIIKTCK